MADDLWDLSALQDQDAPPSLARARDRLGMKMMANKQLFGSVLQSEHNVADRFLPAASGQNQQPLSSSQDGRQTSPVYNRPYGSGSRSAAPHGAESGPGPTGGNPIRQMHQYLNVLGLQTAPPGSGPGAMTQSGRPVVGILKKPVGILKKPSASASSSQSAAPADPARHQPLPSRPMAMSSLQQASLASGQHRPPVAGHLQLSQASLTDSLPIAPPAGKLPSGASAQSARPLTSSHPLHPSMVSLDRRQALAAALQLQRFSLTDSLPIKPLEAVAPRQQASAPMSEKEVLSLTNALPLNSLRDKLLRLSTDNESKSLSSNRLETDTPPASGKAGQDRSEEGKTRKSRTRSHHSPRKSSDRRRGRDTEDLPPVQYPASVVPRPQRSEAAPQTAATVRASDGIAFVKGSTSSSGMITYKYGVAPSAKSAAATPLSVVGGSSQLLPPAASSTPMMLAAATANKLRAKLAYSEMVASATLPGSARLVSTSSRRRKSQSKSPGSNELWSRARDNESPQRSQSRSVKNLERSRDSRSSSRTVTTVGDAAKKSGSHARDRAEKSRSRSRGRSKKSRSGSRDRKRKSRSRSKDRRRTSRSRSRDRKRKSRSRSRDRKRKSRSRSTDRRRKSRSRSRGRRRKSRSPSRDRKRKSRSRSRDRKRKSRSRSRGRSRKSRSNSRDRRKNSRSSSRDHERKSRSRDLSRKNTSRSRVSARKSRSRSMSQKRLLGDHAHLRRSPSQERSRKKSHSQDRLGRRSRSTDRIPRSQDTTRQLSRSRSRTPKRIRHSRSPIASYRRSSQSPPLRRARRSNSPVPSDRLAPGNPWRVTTYDGRAFLPQVRGLDRPGMEGFRGEVMDSRLGYGSHGVPVFHLGHTLLMGWQLAGIHQMGLALISRVLMREWIFISRVFGKGWILVSGTLVKGWTIRLLVREVPTLCSVQRQSLDKRDHRIGVSLASQAIANQVLTACSAQRWRLVQNEHAGESTTVKRHNLCR